MKILQINKFLYRKGGTEVYCLSLGDLLQKNGHEVIYFSMQDERNINSSQSDYFVSNIDFSQKRSILNSIKSIPRVIWSQEAVESIDKLITNEKPDIVHLHNIYRHITPSIIPVIKRHKIPIVMTLHDYFAICPNYQLFSQGKICEQYGPNQYYKLLTTCRIKDSFSRSMLAMFEGYYYQYKKVWDKIDLFLAPSRFIREKFIEFGYPEEKMVHLPLFLEESFINQSENMSGKGGYFLFAGRLSSEKGLNFLIEFFKENPKYKLKIAGSGPDEQILIETANNNNNIDLLGYQERGSLQKLITEARAIIIPSIWYENAPYSVMEPMALGKVVIGSKIGGIPELVEERKTGLLFEPNSKEQLLEKIQFCVEEEKEIEKMGQNARAKMIQDFSNEKHYRKLMKIYQNL